MSAGIPNLVHEMLRYPDELRRAHAILVGREGQAALTERQHRLLTFVRDFQNIHGSVPTYRQIAIGLGITLSSVNQQVRQLEDRGAITRTPRRRQSIVIVEGRS